MKTKTLQTAVTFTAWNINDARCRVSIAKSATPGLWKLTIVEFIGRAGADGITDEFDKLTEANLMKLLFAQFAASAMTNVRTTN